MSGRCTCDAYVSLEACFLIESTLGYNFGIISGDSFCDKIIKASRYLDTAIIDHMHYVREERNKIGHPRKLPIKLTDRTEFESSFKAAMEGLYKYLWRAGKVSCFIK